MVAARRQSFRSMVITDIRVGTGITKKLIDELVRELIQDDIAQMFLRERTNLGALKPPRNRAYIRRKARSRLPFGNKKGHLTGRLQRTLDRNILWTTNYRRPTSRQPGRAVVILNRAKLDRLVTYLKYYARGYTQQGAGVLIVAKKHVTAMQTRLRQIERQNRTQGGAASGSIRRAVRGAVRNANRRTRQRRRA